MLRLLGILALGNMIFGGRRRNGGFPGGLLILLVLMFGGWSVIAVIGGILGLIGSVIGGIFSGLSSLATAAFSGGGVAIGIVIGLAAYYYFRNRKKEETFRQEAAGTVDGAEAEEIIEPEKAYRTNF